MRVEQIGDATLMLADCRDVLREVASVDAVVTDPPYGIGFTYESHDDNTAAWYELMNEVVPLIQKVSRAAVMPACDQTRIGWWYANHPPKWIIAWYKGSPGHLSKIGFNCWEAHLVWGTPPGKVHDHFQTPLTIDVNGHPCPKPVAYTDWLVSRFARPGELVMDPFMGSGTTGVSCVKIGRKFLGVEKDPKYFDIACERVRAMQSQGRLFA